MRWMTFGGKALSDFNVYVDGSQVYKKPAKTFSKYSIPGRNGDIFMNTNRYENVTLSFKCFIRQNFGKNYSDLMDYLNSFDGYQKLETSEEPLVYRKALFHSSVNPNTGAFNHYGSFTLTFDCMPQQFLKTGDNPIYIAPNKTVKLTNPTYQKAKPFITVNAGENGSIAINEESILLDLNFLPTYIDCELLDAWAIADGIVVNANQSVDISDNPIVLNPGVNEITTTNCSIAIMPRWWKI